MTEKEAREAIDIIKSECYVMNPLNLDRTRMINTALDVAIKALKDKGFDQGYSEGFADAVRVKKVLRPKGEWIKIGDIGLAYKCSNCNEIDCKASRYCPNCGADMRGNMELEKEKEYTISYNEALKMVFKALEAQSCEDCISRKSVATLVDELARAISDERCYISRGRSTATIMQDILDLPPVTPKAEWIPCGERLPEEDGQYLITVKYKPESDYENIYAEHGEWADGRWDMFCFGHCGEVEDIVAWMPLPQPYKEGDTDD